MDKVGTTPPLQGFVVVHFTTNRVRLRARDTETKQQLGKISDYLKQQKGFQSVRINQKAGSLVINSETEQLTLIQLKEMLEPFAAVELENEAQVEDSKVYSQTWQRLQGFIPPILGLVAIRGLGITGWKALITYLMTTGVTREIVEQFNVKESKSDKNGQPEAEQAEAAEKQLLESLNSDYQVLHLIPGRMRLRVPAVQEDSTFSQKLETLYLEDNPIIEIQVNPKTASVLIHYQTQPGSSKAQLTSDAIELIGCLKQLQEAENQQNGAKKKDSQLKDAPEKREEQQTESFTNTALEKAETEVKTTSVNSDKEDDQDCSPPDLPSIHLEQNSSTSDLPSIHLEQNSATPSPVNLTGGNQDSPNLEVTSDASLGGQGDHGPTFHHNNTDHQFEPNELGGEQPKGNFYSFKSSVLNSMLNLMANFPLKKA